MLQADRERLRHAVGLAGAIVLAAGLRLHGLTRHSLWLDEAYSVAVARQGAAAIARSLAHDPSPPLYYLLLHGWMSLFGDGEAAVRLLSVIFGILLVPATAVLARRLGGARAALAAAFLAAATPMAVQFSQEARMYALLSLLAVLASERLLAYLEDGRRSGLLAHALLLAAACYTHNWGLLLFPGVLLAVLLYPRRRLAGWAPAALLALALYAPWLPVLWTQARDPSYLFIARVQAAGAWGLPFRSLVLFASGVGTIGGEAKSLLPGPSGWLAAAAWALFLAGALRPADRRRANAAALFAGVAPLAAAAIISASARSIYLLGRYEIMVLGILLAVLAGGAAVLLQGRLFPAALSAWVAGLLALSLVYTSAPQRRFPERDMAQRLARDLRPGDRVVFCGLYRAAMEYYLRRAGAPYEPASFPPEAAGHLGWYYEDLQDPGDPALAAAGRAHCPPAGARTWAVMTAGRTCRRLFDELSGCARLSSPYASLGLPYDQVVLAEPAPR